MQREEALEKIAWHALKQIGRDEAEALIIEFFSEPLKPSLREKLNITAIMQWETHQPPPDLKPGNPIYRPILIDKMKRGFRGATNEYLANYLKNNLALSVDIVEGELPGWLACPVCGYHTFEVLGAWDTCPVCGWNSDPVQETMHDDPTGGNGISLNEARQNFQTLGAITQEKLGQLNPEDKQKFPQSA
ncbi:MAG: CPCC family cysteine-rich protein [Chloroflexota bacterium]